MYIHRHEGKASLLALTDDYASVSPTIDEGSAAPFAAEGGMRPFCDGSTSDHRRVNLVAPSARRR